MTFSDLSSRLKKYWWVIILTTLIAVVFFVPRLSADKYFASIGVGISYNDDSFPTTGDAASGYTDSLEKLSLFLTERYNAVENQQVVAAEMGVNPNYSHETAFYNVVNNNGGFVTLSTESGSQEEADKFISGVKKAYTAIVAEWNSSRAPQYRVQAQTDFNQTVTTQKAPLQVKFLPVLAGFLIGCLLALILPLKKELKS